MISVSHQTTAGELFEVLTFSNKMQVVYSSSFLHRVNFMCSDYGLNVNDWNQFNRAVELVKEKHK